MKKRKNEDVLSGLSWALYKGYFKVAKFLIAIGADVNYGDKHGNSLLHWACQQELGKVVKFLLENGADVNARNDLGETPLHVASYERNAKIVKLLLEAGADTTAKNNEGKSVFYYEWVGPNKGGTSYTDTRNLLADVVFDSRIKRIKEWGFEETWDRLIDICHRGDIDRLKKFIEAGGDINIGIGTEYGVTILHMFHPYPFPDSVVRVLIDNGFNVNAKDNNGCTPLHGVCMFRFVGTRKKGASIAKMLIDAGADVNHRNDLGETPLYYAFRGGDIEVVKVLIDAGADVNAKDNDGITPAHDLIYEIHHWERSPEHARFGKEVTTLISLFIDKGVDFNAKDNNGKAPLDYWDKKFRDKYEKEIKALQEIKT